MQISNARASAEPEVRLVERARSGDEAAIRSLIQQNNRRLYRLAGAVLGNALDAEDVMQEAYFRAFSHLDGFRSESGFTTWLTRIALNEALQRLRRRRLGLRLTDGFSLEVMGQIIGFPGRPASDDPESAAARRQLREVIEAAVERLPRDLRVVFVLREIEEMSTTETAEQLGLPEATVKTRLHRARRRLRDLLDAEVAAALRGTFPFAGARCQRMADSVIRRLRS